MLSMDNGIAYFAGTVSYVCKMFMKLTAGVDAIKLSSPTARKCEPTFPAKSNICEWGQVLTYPRGEHLKKI